MPMSRRHLLWFLATGAGTALAAGAVVWQAMAPPRRTASGDRLETVPAGQLPSFARSPQVQAVYRFAAANGDLLQYIPCYCGCASFGHRHNGDCYVARRVANGRITFTSHGAA
ncbi:MAG: hypothetical protein KatS3mg131_3934 [Candidatus Tectimicrobiota bacterium]|nr:MAG: hypothetical protein KatS3mg131_3934 [Candidatus Tectomicrobia bacterium]